MCPTLTVGSFFRRVRSTFCWFVQQRQTSTTSNLKSASKTKRRNKTDVQNLEIALRIPLAPFFSALCDFFETFWIAPKGPPSFFSYFATSWSFTKSEGSPFTILNLRYCADFGRSRLVKNNFVKAGVTIRFEPVRMSYFLQAFRSRRFPLFSELWDFPFFCLWDLFSKTFQCPKGAPF